MPELLLLAPDYLRVLVPHDPEHAVQELVVLVVTVRTRPGV